MSVVLTWQLCVCSGRMVPTQQAERWTTTHWQQCRQTQAVKGAHKAIKVLHEFGGHVPVCKDELRPGLLASPPSIHEHVILHSDQLG